MRSSPRGTSYEAIFSAKHYSDGKIYFLNSDGNDGDDARNTNNRMYVLQLTSTSDDYVISYPELQEGYLTVGGNDVTFYTSSDDVISPAFMLASTLGAINGASNSNGCTKDYRNAAAHCALYKEVAMDGTEYTGWRLPTKQEIQYMINHQDGSDVMVKVLTGKYYWALNGEAAIYSAGNTLPEDAALIRCVRDVTPEELERINQF